MHMPRWETSFPEPGPQEDTRPGLDANASRGLAYKCDDCAWTGVGGPKALDHHRENHHVLRLVKLPGLVVSFSCCEDVHGRRVDAEGCSRCGADIDQACTPWCGEA